MYVDKKTLLLMLDKKDEKYKDNKLIINLLPKKSYFEILDEDTLTALYYNEKEEETLLFKLEFDHLNQNNINYVSEKKDMDNELYEYMSLEKDNHSKKIKSNLSCILILFLFALIALSSVIYLILLYYK